jgi:hypothetical protein
VGFPFNDEDFFWRSDLKPCASHRMLFDGFNHLQCGSIVLVGDHPLARLLQRRVLGL